MKIKCQKITEEEGKKVECLQLAQHPDQYHKHEQVYMVILIPAFGKQVSNKSH